MHRAINRLSLKQAQRLINKKMIELQNKLITSPNEYYTVLIFLEMSEILSTEIDAWAVHVAAFSTDNYEDDSDLLDNASRHMSELIELEQKISSARAEILPKALAIKLAMENSHQLTKSIEPKLKA